MYIFLHLFIYSFVFRCFFIVRTDKEKSRYTGAILGLGSDPVESDPFLPDHDIELTFDFAFTEQDLVKVGPLYWLQIASRGIGLKKWGKYFE